MPKSTLAAFLLLCHLVGPEAGERKNSQLYSTARSRDQAKLIWHLAHKIVRMSPDLRANIVIRESRNELHCPDLGTTYRALSADAVTAYGLNPAFIIHDELEQSGVCDGAGFWVGRDPILNMGRKLLALTEQRSDQRVSDGTPGPAG
jgi:phage terminase large subunit-like protein